MKSGKHLHLDEILTSYPELGPTVPDGGYAWIVLCGVFLIQMTIPSILMMYGIVLVDISRHKSADYDIWNEKIVLTSILFAAFWNLADPWTRMIVSMASRPRLVGLVGVFLLTFGIISSGYLATGGVGAYLASPSAGAAMGIGASFVIVLSNYVLRKYFRKKLLIALTLSNVGTSFGLTMIPSFTYLLLNEARLPQALQLMATVLLPTVLGILTFRLPSEQRSSPYSLLLSTEEDAKLPLRISSDVTKDSQHPNSQDEIENLDYGQTEGKMQQAGGLLSEGNNMYAYEDMDEDVDLFVNPTTHTDNKWAYQLQAFKSFRFWAATIGWVGMKMSALFFWLFLPIFGYECARNWMNLSIQTGFSTVLPNLISYKALKLSSQYRRLYFGSACWLCAISLIGLSRAPSYEWLEVFGLLGGISTGALSSCQDLALYDVLGSETVRSVHKGLSVIVGLSILGICLVHNVNLCMDLAALLQLLGGLYWISSPLLRLIKATCYRFRQQNRTETRRDSI